MPSKRLRNKNNTKESIQHCDKEDSESFSRAKLTTSLDIYTGDCRGMSEIICIILLPNCCSNRMSLSKDVRILKTCVVANEKCENIAVTIVGCHTVQLFNYIPPAT